MMRASIPPMPLVISVSEPRCIISARSGNPDPCRADEKPTEIDSTETNTITTPAMPIIATTEEPSRAGSVCRLIHITARVCLSHAMAMLRPPQRVGDAQPHCSPGGRNTCNQAHECHESNTHDNVEPRQDKDRQLSSRIAALHDQPGDGQPESAA